MTALAQMVHSFSMPKCVLAGALGASLAAGIASFTLIQHSIEADAKARFEHYARNAQQAVALRVKSYTGLLVDTASMLRSTGVGRDQFRAYVAGLRLDKNYPGVVAINYATRVKRGELKAYEARMREIQRREGFSTRPFRVWPEGDRDEYWVLDFIEGMPDKDDVFGYDILSPTPDQRLYMNGMGDSGEISTLARMSRVPGPGTILATARAPVYRRGMPTATLLQRRAAYEGSLGIAVSMLKLMEGVAEAIPAGGVRLIVEDYWPTRPTRRAQLLYDSFTTRSHPAPPFKPDSADFVSTGPVFNQSHTWRLTVSAPKSHFFGESAGYFPWLAFVLAATATLVVIALLRGLVTSRRQAIGLAHQLRKLAAHADAVKEGERKRIAREIHDDLGQSLLALRIEADQMVARTAQRQPRLHQRARATMEQIDATIRSVRQIINDLRPPALDFGLSAAVAWQVREFQRRTGIECTLDDRGQDVQLDEQYAIALFRVLQEALHNVARHAGPCQVVVALGLDGGCAFLTVTDNGVGLPPKAHGKAGSFGLLGMSERIAILGGTCAVTGGPGAGTAVRVTVPLKHQEHRLHPVGAGAIDETLAPQRISRPEAVEAVFKDAA